MSGGPTAAAIARAVRAGESSAADQVAGALERIDAADPAINAFLETFGERAREEAARIDQRLARGEDVGPLAGVPIGVKDTICLDHGRTTCGSRFLETYESPYTATALQRLIDAGAIVVGKTNCDEFAMGSSGEHSAFGVTRNPWSAEHVPGGSSSGSAAAVAAGMVPMALGSDTGGSIRQPAAYCGVVGLKPTYGAVSRYGLVAYASSLDQIGPLTRTVEDAALVFSVLAGHDPLDATSVDAPVADPSVVGAGADGMRVGVPRDLAMDRNDAAVNESFERSLDHLRAAGVGLVDVELPNLASAIAAYYLIAPCEASSNLARYDGIRYGRRAELGADEGLETLYARSRAEGFGAEVQRRILLGTFALSAGYYDNFYGAALRARRLVKNDFDAVLGGEDGAAVCDAIALPTAPTPAFCFGDCDEDPVTMYLQDVYTVPANLAGLPGLSVPMGIASGDGPDLPLGFQLLARPFGEASLFRLGAVLERAVGPMTATPPA